MSNPSTSGDFTISHPAELASQKSEWLFLDVRTPGEFDGAHIPGSVSHPLHSLDASAVSQLMEGQRGCVVVCQGGTRARQAASQLAAAGLRGITVLEGGVNAWDAAGLPLTVGRGVISLERQVRIAAGLLVVIGVVLGWLVHPAWIALSGFVGAGLVFAGVTDTCGMGMLLAKMPWNHVRQTGKP